MSIFETVKASADMMSVAEYYGVAIRHEFTNCIFHNDKHPSMKLYKDHYHCFSCGAHGDVIRFTAQLFGLSQYEAAKRLSIDFGIAIDYKSIDNTSKVLSIPKNHSYVTILSEYISVLKNNKIKYAPENPDEELHPLYIESLQQLPQYQYYLDILTKSNNEEQKKFIEQERRFFNELRTKVRQSSMAV